MALISYEKMEVRNTYSPRVRTNVFPSELFDSGFQKERNILEKEKFGFVLEDYVF